MDHLGLVEAKHKASPPFKVMVWLGLYVDTINMTITIPQEKLAKSTRLVAEWQGTPTRIYMHYVSC